MKPSQKSEIIHTEAESKDYWLFMYLCNGINVKDMCLLKYGNIKGDVLEFERAKTVRTKRNVEPIRIALNEDILRIIKKWGNREKDKDNYIFPVLTKGLTPERERQLIQQCQNYLAGFEDETKKETTKALTTFKQSKIKFVK